MRFFLIVLLASILRVSLILCNQSHVDGDEAVIGLMGKHIYEKGIHPIYMYGQPYNGGASIEAHIVSLICPFTGISPILLKTVALSLSLLALVLTYLTAKRIYGEGTALLTSLLFALFPSTLVWNLKLSGGHQVIMIVSIVLFYLSVLIFYEKRSDNTLSLFLGFFSGLGLYNLELIFPLVSVTLFLWILPGMGKPRPILYLLGFLLGYSPALYFNLTGNFANWGYLIGGGKGTQGLFVKLQEIFRTLFLDFPRSFHPDADWQAESWNDSIVFREGINVHCWLSFFIFLASLFSLRQRFQARSFFPLFFLCFFLSYSMGRPTHLPTYRYFLALYPLLPILIAVSLSVLYRGGSTVRRVLAILVAAYLSFIGLFEYVERIPRESVIYDAGLLTIGPKPITKFYPTRGESLSRIISILKTKDVLYVYAPFYLKYRLIFESKEVIIASARPFEAEARDIGYDEKLEKAQRFGFVFYQGSPYDRFIREAMKRHGFSFEHYVLGGMSLYIPRNFSMVRERILDRLRISQLMPRE